MTALETQAADLSAQIAGIDRSMEELRVERLRVYRCWVEVTQQIAAQRNHEQRERQSLAISAESANVHGFVQNPLQEWDRQHAETIR